MNQIQPGITTEAELRQRFGPPDTWLKNNRGESSFAWFRSLGPNAGGYVPVFGEALGGLNLEVQQLSVVVEPERPGPELHGSTIPTGWPRRERRA